MINIVLFEPEIPQNTGNIMRTCYMDEAHLKRSGVNYVNECKYTLYDNFDDFLSKNSGEMYFFTRYGKKPHSDFDYKNDQNIYLIFGKESTGIPKEILKKHLDRCIRIP